MTKCKYFLTATQLTAFINDVTSGVTSIVAITFDTSSGQYVLFFN